MSCVTGGPGSGRRHSAVPDSPQLTRRVGGRWRALGPVGRRWRAAGGRHLASEPPPDGRWACANALGGRWQRRWRWTTEDRWSVGALDYGRPLATAPRPPPPFLLPSSLPPFLFSLSFFSLPPLPPPLPRLRRGRIFWTVGASGRALGAQSGALACPLEARLGALEGVGTRSRDESVGALDPVGAPGGGAGCPRVVLGLGVEGEWPGRA